MKEGRKKTPLVVAFGVTEVERLTGVSRVTLHVWDRSGFFRPSLAPGGKGTGNRRKYSFADIVAVRVVKKLRDEGIGLRALRKVAAKVREFEKVENPFAERYLAVRGKDVVLIRGDEVVSVLSAPGQYTLFLHLDLGAEADRLLLALHTDAA